MEDKIKEIQEQFDTDLAEADDLGKLDYLYLKYFSKSKGLTTNLIRDLPKLGDEDKKTYGPLINSTAQEQKNAIEKAKNELELKLKSDPLIDLTAPKKPKKTGYLHPLTQVTREINDFFRYHGYSIAEGPEIETVEYNFRKLNLPEGHPATDLQDTLFVKSPDILLTTHTSSIEARVLSEQKPPIRVAFPGKCFRNETPNSTNTPFFNQYQGVVVDKGINIQHLKSILTLFHQFLFGDDVELRFRYKYYPEVSPGMGVDMKCKFCNGDGCGVCQHRGHVEILGSGMIHYNTLEMCGIDPEEYTGFAFGMGLDRLVLQKFGIEDIRYLYGGDGIVYK